MLHIYVPPVMRHKMLSLISLCSCITDVIVELSWSEKCICVLHALEERQDLWEGTCVSRARSCSCVSPPNSTSLCTVFLRVNELTDNTIQHTFISCGSARGLREPESWPEHFALCATHSFIRLTSRDVVLTRNGLKTFKSSTYCLLYAWRQCFKANIGARASL